MKDTQKQNPGDYFGASWNIRRDRITKYICYGAVESLEKTEKYSEEKLLPFFYLRKIDKYIEIWILSYLNKMNSLYREIMFKFMLSKIDQAKA